MIIIISNVCLQSMSLWLVCLAPVAGRPRPLAYLVAISYSDVRKVNVVAFAKLSLEYKQTLEVEIERKRKKEMDEMKEQQ